MARVGEQKGRCEGKVEDIERKIKAVCEWDCLKICVSSKFVLIKAKYWGGFEG